MPPREIGDRMRECFESYRPEGPGPEGNAPGNMAPGNPPTGGGHGGCTNQEECQKYCESNPEACENFQPSAQPMPGTAPVPCESGNCPPPPGDQQYQLPQPGQTPMQPGQQTPPPSGEMMPPQEPGQPPPPAASPPPTESVPPPPTSFNLLDLITAILLWWQ